MGSGQQHMHRHSPEHTASAAAAGKERDKSAIASGVDCLCWLNRLMLGGQRVVWGIHRLHLLACSSSSSKKAEACNMVSREWGIG